MDDYLTIEGSKLFSKIFGKKIAAARKTQAMINQKYMDKLYEEFLADTKKLVSGSITEKDFVERITDNMNKIDGFALQRSIFMFKEILLFSPFKALKAIFTFKFRPE